MCNFWFLFRYKEKQHLVHGEELLHLCQPICPTREGFPILTQMGAPTLKISQMLRVLFLL